jgi:hypothetical protein
MMYRRVSSGTGRDNARPVTRRDVPSDYRWFCFTSLANIGGKQVCTSICHDYTWSNNYLNTVKDVQVFVNPLIKNYIRLKMVFIKKILSLRINQAFCVWSCD